jgi:hypothetical protein
MAANLIYYGIMQSFSTLGSDVYTIGYISYLFEIIGYGLACTYLIFSYFYYKN